MTCSAFLFFLFVVDYPMLTAITASVKEKFSHDVTAKPARILTQPTRLCY